MLRANIEQFMKQNKMTTITLWYNKEDALGVRCELKNGYLTDWTNHRVDRKKDIWGYTRYDYQGNADKLSWSGDFAAPLLRKGKRVDIDL